jgi:hypothetical protein
MTDTYRSSRRASPPVEPHPPRSIFFIGHDLIILNTDMLSTYEIVGLHSNTNGRMCTSHQCCGDHLRLNDLVRVKKCVLTVAGRVEEAGKVVRIIDGCESCTVGFIPKVLLHGEHLDNILNKYGQVTEMYDNSENSFKRRKSHLAKGMALCSMLNDVAERE